MRMQLLQEAAIGRVHKVDVGAVGSCQHAVRAKGEAVEHLPRRQAQLLQRHTQERFGVLLQRRVVVCVRACVCALCV